MLDMCFYNTTDFLNRLLSIVFQNYGACQLCRNFFTGEHNLDYIEVTVLNTDFFGKFGIRIVNIKYGEIAHKENPTKVR